MAETSTHHKHSPTLSHAEGKGTIFTESSPSLRHSYIRDNSASRKNDNKSVLSYGPMSSKKVPKDAFLY